MAIYEGAGEGGFVRTSDVARALKVKPPSVTETFQKLSQEGVIEYIRSRGVRLTERGKRIAKKVTARRDDLRGLLLYIGAPRKLAESECKDLEMVMSDRAIEYIRNFLIRI